MYILNQRYSLYIYFAISAIILFIYSRMCCPCPPNNTNIHNELEWHGWSLSHVFLYAGAGFLFPIYMFWEAQLIGILFEILQYIFMLPYWRDTVLHYIGGCYMGNSNVHWLDHITGPHSHYHWWHTKITDVICNVIGWLVGLAIFWLIFKINSLS